MKRRLFLLIPLAATITRADDFADRAAAHNAAFGLWYRRYLGCEPHARETAECRPLRGGNDFKLFGKARTTAAKFFGFEE